MQRQFSVDDFTNLGNFWKLGASMAGFPRTDSEAAFQDFLKRIPSTSNLAAQAQGLDQAQQLHLQQQVQQFQQAQQAGLHAAGSALTGGALGEVGGLNVGGIPRVPSLDLLRQLVQVNQTLSPQSHKGATSLPEVGIRPTEPELAPIVSSSAATLPLLTSVPLSSGLPQTSSNVNPVAAALQLGNFHGMPQQMRSAGNTSDCPTSDKETNGKAELRRARRMLSNRESARRSRRRKQEHLSTLEEEISKLNDDKRALMDQIEDLEKQLKKRDEENARLRKDNEQLREECGHKQDSSRKVHRSSSLQRMASADHTPKKACHSRANRQDGVLKAEVEAAGA
ncbi:g124 [Coccomyxa elongata]